MKEIAERAGVHPSTVDKVVHHRVGVSDAVRARVQAIINELGYTPNPSGRVPVSYTHLTLPTIA